MRALQPLALNGGGKRATALVRPQKVPLHVQVRSAARDARLQALGFADYSEYLRSPEWRGVKARYIASDLPQTCICGEIEVDMHHLTYERVGQERITDLMPLCRTCHEMVHDLERRRKIGLDLAGLEDERRAEHRRAQTRVEQSAEDRRRLMAREAFHATLPLHVRLRRLIEAAGPDRDLIRRDLLVVRSIIRKAERRSGNVSPGNRAVIDRHVREAAERLTAIKPQALDVLAAGIPEDVIDAQQVSEPEREPIMPNRHRGAALKVLASADPDAECDGTPTCVCPPCAKERAIAVARGCRPWNQSRIPSRAA